MDFLNALESSNSLSIDIVKDMDIKEMHYFNPKEIRANNTDTYKEIVELLGDNLNADVDGNKNYTFLMHTLFLVAK